MRLADVSVFGLVLLCLLAVFALNRAHTAETGGYQLKLPDHASVEHFDFEQRGIENWESHRRKMDARTAGRNAE